MSRSPLDPSKEDVLRMGRAVIDLVAGYYDALPRERLFPDTDSARLRAALDQRLPLEGEPFEALLDVVREVVIPGTRHNGHPRFFGYVASPGTPATALADLLASALNSNVTAWRSAPAATEIERLTIGWIAELLGLPRATAGLFVSGGSTANFAALAAARQRAAPEITANGASGTPPLTIYVSTEGHHSLHKAAALLGIGRSHVREVATRDDGSIDLDALERLLAEDRRLGRRPICVVANAGSVMTGAFDPLDALADVADRHGLWLHVDACYGGFAALAPSARPRFAALGRADSVALDPHKWLYVPVDCGCVLYRDADAAAGAFTLDAEYTRVTGLESEESFAFWNHGPELSRRFRALKVWTMLRHAGTRALGEAIETNLRRADELARLVDASSDFERLAPVGLSIVCFRHVPERLRGAGPSELDAFNERLMVALQRGGDAYVSNARVNGRFALRACIVNFRTTEGDVARLIDALRDLGNRI